jgi:hypothetical protein
VQEAESLQSLPQLQLQQPLLLLRWARCCQQSDVPPEPLLLLGLLPSLLLGLLTAGFSAACWRHRSSLEVLLHQQQLLLRRHEGWHPQH